MNLLKLSRVNGTNWFKIGANQYLQKITGTTMTNITAIAPNTITINNPTVSPPHNLIIYWNLNATKETNWPQTTVNPFHFQSTFIQCFKTKSKWNLKIPVPHVLYLPNYLFFVTTIYNKWWHIHGNIYTQYVRTINWHTTTHLQVSKQG